MTGLLIGGSAHREPRFRACPLPPTSRITLGAGRDPPTTPATSPMASLVEAQGLGARRARSAGGPIRRRARDNRLGRCVPCLGGVLRRRAPYPLARFSVPTDRQNSAPQPPLRGTRHQLPTVLPRRRPLTRRLPAGRALPEEGRTPHRRQRPLCARRRRAGRQIPHLPFMAYGHSLRRGRARVDGNELPQGLDVHGQVVADLTLDAMK